MVIGDFNEIPYHFEKVGGRQRSETLMSNFRQAMEVCNLYDLGHMEDPFTWSNKHEIFTFTKERFDRVVANQVWIRLYNDVKVETLVSLSSDHKPLLASCGQLGAGYIKGGRLFRYDTFWDLENECSSKVEHRWRRHGHSSNPLSKVQFLLNVCQQGFKKVESKALEGEIRGD